MVWTTILCTTLLTAVAPSDKVMVATSVEKVTVALLGSDRDGSNRAITLDVKQLAKEMDPSKVRLIYNGGESGLRYSFVKEFQQRGGEVIAYRVQKEKKGTPKALRTLWLENDSQRLDQIYRDSDIYLALPGGMETLGEISFVVDQNTAKDGRLKPVLVFDAHDYYKRFFQCIEYVEKEGFMDHRRLFRRSVKEESSIPRVLSQIYALYHERVTASSDLKAPLSTTS